MLVRTSELRQRIVLLFIIKAEFYYEDRGDTSFQNW